MYRKSANTKNIGKLSTSICATQQLWALISFKYYWVVIGRINEQKKKNSEP